MDSLVYSSMSDDILIFKVMSYRRRFPEQSLAAFFIYSQLAVKLSGPGSPPRKLRDGPSHAYVQ
jgi:hypothetical protein